MTQCVTKLPHIPDYFSQCQVYGLLTCHTDERLTSLRNHFIVFNKQKTTKDGVKDRTFQ